VKYLNPIVIGLSSLARTFRAAYTLSANALAWALSPATAAIWKALKHARVILMSQILSFFSNSNNRCTWLRDLVGCSRTWTRSVIAPSSLSIDRIWPSLWSLSLRAISGREHSSHAQVTSRVPLVCAYRAVFRPHFTPHPP
jgi:hypothetical protein